MGAKRSRFHPIEDHVVVKRDPTESMTKGGIVLPDSAKTRCRNGTVIAVGPGRMDFGVRVQPELEPGNRVVLPAFVGAEVELGGVKYVVVKQGEILTRLEEE